jgi:hypothetical protein
MAEAEKENKRSNNTNAWAVGAVIATGVVMLAIIVWVIKMAFSNDGVGNFASIATLILVGLAAFIGIMNMLSLTAHWMNIVDLKQPFGLPEGTVRAILTIAFIVLVGVLTSFLLSNSQRPPFSKDALTVASGIPLSAATVLEQKFSAEGVVTVTKDVVPEAARTAAENAAKEAVAAGKPAPPPVAETHTVKFYPRIDYRQNDEIAKQILTILSTILAAMIGFYFGAKPGESSAPRADAAPQKPDDKAALLAEYNTLKAKPPTLTTVSSKIAAIADQARRALLQGELDAIKTKLDAADKALADPAATIDVVRTNLAIARTEFGHLTELDKKI